MKVQRAVVVTLTVVCVWWGAGGGGHTVKSFTSKFFLCGGKEAVR